MTMIDYGWVLFANILFVLNQVLMKLWMTRFKVSFWPVTADLFRALLAWEVAVSVVSFFIGTFLWIDLLRRFEFSVIYPLISISYVIALLAALIVFREQVSLQRWLGALLIIVGTWFIGKS